MEMTPHTGKTTLPKGKEDYEFITIPERDEIMDWQHPGIGINLDHYGPGVHLVSPQVAETIKDRLEVYRRAQVRILQPKADKKSLREANKSRPEGGTVYDASQTSPTVL